MNINPLDRFSITRDLAETEFSKNNLKEAENFILSTSDELVKLIHEDPNKGTRIVKEMNDKILQIVAKYKDNFDILSDDTRTNLQELIYQTKKCVNEYEKDPKVRNIALKELNLVDEMLENTAASASNTPPVATTSPLATARPISFVEDFEEVIGQTPQFNFYRIKDVDFVDLKNKPQKASHLTITSFEKTPLEFCAEALGIPTNPRTDSGYTLLGFKDFNFKNNLLNKIFFKQDELFSIKAPDDRDKAPDDRLDKAPDDRDKAPDDRLEIYGGFNSSLIGHARGTDIFGSGEFKMSYGELNGTYFSSQEYVSELLPLNFWRDLKVNMDLDGIIYLPGSDNDIKFLEDLKKFPHCRHMLENFESDLSPDTQLKKFYDDFLNRISLYQMATQVVTMQDLYVVCDGDGKIMQREPGSTRPITQVNMCGIRGIQNERTPREFNQDLLTNAFYTAMRPANKEIMVLPAVGMGVWAGDPELYWKSFFEAYLDPRIDLKALFVNPGHSPTPVGSYKNYRGNEFEDILKEYKNQNRDNPEKLAKLNRIRNLYDDKTDIVQLAHNLAQKFQDTKVYLVNASDPDVTMGNCVGEYCKHKCHTGTTEENFMCLMPMNIVTHPHIRGRRPTKRISSLN